MIAIGNALRQGTQAIQGQCISQTPLLDASLLLCAVTGMTREQLYSRSAHLLSTQEFHRYTELIAQRCESQPIAYLTGTREFFGHAFTVTPDVLIPRADTEILVEQAVLMLGTHDGQKVLDLCCGSGCIGISVASAVESATVALADISESALVVAGKNSRSILGRSLETVASDLYRALQNRRFHMIMTNPPYLTDQWYEQTEMQVRKEPELALIGGGEDGLDIIRRIIGESPDHLEAGGTLLIECDYRQNESVAKLLAERGFSSIGKREDLAQVRRIVWGTWHV
ncbi:MAG: peptide chain release factor N(5)-glutamine methyltransferase [Sphaerochaetaceae bacterium]|jgi:release factor glutamine methyltransferase|nr:peptide chain release factor N(5)-glutamine methyltransferase [Sphaerochaetaceae bacterium]